MSFSKLWGNYAKIPDSCLEIQGIEQVYMLYALIPAVSIVLYDIVHYKLNNYTCIFIFKGETLVPLVCHTFFYHNNLRECYNF